MDFMQKKLELLNSERVRKIYVGIAWIAFWKAEANEVLLNRVISELKKNTFIVGKTYMDVMILNHCSLTKLYPD
jgi:hypothetical protein